MTSHAPESSPVPAAPAGRLFFAERLPAAAESESPAEAEARVLLDLETGAPLPPEKLAYGWVRLPSREILYYAAPRDRLAAHDAFAPAGTVLPEPEGILLPDGVSPDDFLRASRDFHADLRPRVELAELRSRAVADAMLSRIALPLKLFAATGFLLVLVAAGFTAATAVAQRRLDSGAEAAKTAEANADMLTSLERLEGPGRSIFDALAIVNPSRPEGVSFTRVALTGSNDLALDGRASGTSGVSAVTRLESALKATGIFTVADSPKVETSGGRSTFRMRFSMTRWPKVVDSPTSLPAPAVAAESKPEEAR